MTRYFNNPADAAKFADQLLAMLYDTYYVWTEDTQSWRGYVRKCRMLRGYCKLPAKAEETFVGQSVSHCIQHMRGNGWRNIGDDHKFVAIAEHLGFEVRQYDGVRVVTL